jgi:hypothetical protein
MGRTSPESSLRERSYQLLSCAFTNACMDNGLWMRETVSRECIRQRMQRRISKKGTFIWEEIIRL